MLPSPRIPQNIMVDGLIEHLTHLIMILRLPEDPHELCHGGLQGHIVGFDDAEEELKRMEEFRKAQAEVEQKKEKPMSQKMFKVV